MLVTGVDSCNGDSGGPLIARRRSADRNVASTLPMYLKGVVSFGTSQCGIGYPGVYTNIENYVPWIRRNIRP